MYHIIFLFVHINYQDKDDDDGLEQFVRRAIIAKDISWFPMNKGMRLKQSNTREEEIRHKLNDKLQEVKNNVTNNFSFIQANLKVNFEKVSYNLKTKLEA